MGWARSALSQSGVGRNTGKASSREPGHIHPTGMAFFKQIKASSGEVCSDRGRREKAAVGGRDAGEIPKG